MTSGSACKLRLWKINFLLRKAHGEPNLSDRICRPLDRDLWPLRGVPWEKRPAV